jgi:hypothetical protein
MLTCLKIFIIIGIAITFVNVDAHPFTLDGGSMQYPKLKSNTTAKTRSTHTTSNTGFSVINIIIQHMDTDTIYAEDGRYFAIPTSTQIVNNHNPNIKIQLGELFFQDGNLIAIIIK